MQWTLLVGGDGGGSDASFARCGGGVLRGPWPLNSNCIIALIRRAEEGLNMWSIGRWRAPGATFGACAVQGPLHTMPLRGVSEVKADSLLCRGLLNLSGAGLGSPEALLTARPP